MNRETVAFLIALVLYTPLIIALWQGHKQLIVLPAAEPVSAIELAYFIKSAEPELWPTPQEPYAPPQSTPPQAATGVTPKPQEASKPTMESEEPSDLFAPEPLSTQELNRAFEPIDTNQTLAAPTHPVSIDEAEILDLYGDLVYDLSSSEQNFLKDRLDGIGRITQRHLRYPDLAGRLRMSGESVLAFTLLPSGDITPIEVLRSSGYSLLDDNAVRAVEIAHKEYPSPNEPVRIRLRVIYRLY